MLHDYRANIERGWKLLSILCCVIVPNEKLLHCLANWLIDEICKMQGRAGYCLQILQRTSNSKYQRKLAPSFTEIKTVTVTSSFPSQILHYCLMGCCFFLLEL